MDEVKNNHGNEIDVIVENGLQLIPIEIKSTRTFSESLLKGLKYWKELTDEAGYLVYQGERSFDFQGLHVVKWQDVRGTLAPHCHSPLPRE